jgi:thiol-disulfide isomerase/thioredoxin
MVRLGREASRLVPVWVGLVGLMLVLGAAGCGGERKDSAANGREATPAPAAGVEKVASAEPAAQPAPAVAPGPSQPAATSQVASPPAASPTGQAVAPKPAPPAAAPAKAEAASAEAETQEPPLPPLPPVADRKPAPAFSVTDMAGRPVGLDGLKGKVGLVVFWATWCRPCMMEIPELVRLQQAYGSKGLSVVGLSVDRRGLAVVKPFVEKHPEINYPIVPSGLAAADAFGGVTSIPMSFLIDREGRIIRSFIGLMPPEVLEGYVKAALQEQGAS